MSKQQLVDIPAFNPVESEVISLHITIKAIYDMVNHVFLNFSHNERGTEVRFKDTFHAQLFNSLLTDFITPDSNELSHKQESRLDALLRIVRNPQFNEENTVGSLTQACTIFDNWLKCEPVFEKVYFSEINCEAYLSMSRAFFIKACGNIVKHNEMNLSRVAARIRKMLDNNGYEITQYESYMMLENFLEWFHDDIFIYHGTTIIQMLNDIRHAIKSYLLPESMKATKIVYDERFKMDIPRITFPIEMESDYGKFCYHYLIQNVGRKPYVNAFKTPDYLTWRY